MDMYGNQDNSFITILATGDYRVKGKINEQNMGALTEGAVVIVRSRVNDDENWKGTVTKIDRENAENSSNNGGIVYSGGSDNMTQTNSYPFYITLESSEGLMLGQHVYIEPDNGQDEEPKAGIWLDDYFINDIDSKPFVWADNGKGKLEKRYVTLGQHDDNLFKYEIADGLTKEDAVTFPEEGLEEGMETVVSEDGQMGQSNPAGAQDGGDDMNNVDIGNIDGVDGGTTDGMDGMDGGAMDGVDGEAGMESQKIGGGDVDAGGADSSGGAVFDGEVDANPQGEGDGQ